MKKILALLLALVVALSFSACERSEASEASDSVAAEESPEDEAQSAGLSEGDAALVTGTVVYYDGATLAICSLDDTSLQFFVADDEIDKSETRGLATGSETDIYYTGEIDGSNTSAARVTKLVQSPKQSAARTDVSVAGGIITGSDESALSIISFDGKALIFAITGEAIDMEYANGLTEGDYVTVFYEGEIGSGNGSSVKVVKVV